MKSVDQEGFAEAWEHCKPFMVKALAKSGQQWDIDDVWKDIEDGEAVFYPVKDGAAVFKIMLYPRKRMLRIWLFGGKTGTQRANLDAVMEAADYYAELHECEGIELLGRKGWEKVLEPYGYDYKSVLLVKELGG